MIEIEDKIELKNLTTLNIGGVADYLVKTRSREQLLEALEWAEIKKIPLVVIGGGSNLLISDTGFKGLVIVNKGGSSRISGKRLTADSGAFTARLAMETRKEGLSGLEFVSGIPGTIGGAVVGNAGAYGKSLSDLVSWVEVWEAGKTKKLTNKELGYSYRSSIIKKRRSLVVLSVCLMLSNNPAVSQEVIEKDLMKRRTDYVGLNAGSYFKNIEVESLSSNELGKLTNFVNHDKISVGKMIEEAGLKGRKIGGAVISDRHANVIVNNGNSTAADVYGLEKLIVSTIKNKYGITLEPEVVKLEDFT